MPNFARCSINHVNGGCDGFLRNQGAATGEINFGAFPTDLIQNVVAVGQNLAVA